MSEPGGPIDTSRQAKSVAVLPFIAMSNGPDDDYFTDGLTEEIINALAQLPELLVTARTSAFHFKGQNLPVGDIASQLGVQHIVEGSVGGRVNNCALPHNWYAPRTASIFGRKPMTAAPKTPWRYRPTSRRKSHPP
jgi:hypothetical protein